MWKGAQLNSILLGSCPPPHFYFQIRVGVIDFLVIHDQLGVGTLMVMVADEVNPKHLVFLAAINPLCLIK